MRLPRVYINQKLELDKTIALPKENSLHIAKVLRRKAGDKIILFNNILDNNNCYGEYTAEIKNNNKNNLEVFILDYMAVHAKPESNLELAQCISKPQHFEITLQKSVELGIDIITPILSSRSEQIIKNNNIDNKLDRWNKIIISACEQSGRCDVPILNNPIEINQWVYNISHSDHTNLLITLCTKTNNSLHKLDLDNNKNIKLLIGPEGGISDTEIKLLEKNNFNLVKLGSRIMRTETAGIASIAIVQYLIGNL